jgi:hypothetical protein
MVPCFYDFIDTLRNHQCVVPVIVRVELLYIVLYTLTQLGNAAAGVLL